MKALQAICSGLLVIAFIALLRLPAYGSTLWAAAGSQVQDGAVIIAKNHDDKPVRTELRLVIPRKGFTYLGLFSLKGPKAQGPSAGVNEQGLAVVTATPETLPTGPNANPSVEQIAERLLAGFESVGGLLSDQTVLRQGPPAFYLIADRSRVALIEIAPHGQISVRSPEGGILCHTNHYIDEKLLAWNRGVAKNSESRLGRAEGLLQAARTPLNPDVFAEVAHDRGVAADDGILRIPAHPGTPQTLATWILFIPRLKPPELHVGIFGPDGAETEYDFKLDQAFWTEGLR